MEYKSVAMLFYYQGPIASGKENQNKRGKEGMNLKSQMEDFVLWDSKIQMTTLLHLFMFFFFIAQTLQ